MKPALKRTIMATAVVAAAGALGVSDANAQVSATEVYQLVSVGGEQLPAVIEEHGDCRDELHAATLTLGTDGTWLLETEEQEVCGDNTSSDRDDEDGTYHIAGDVIHFMDDDGEALPTDNDDTELEVEFLREATRTDNGLRVTINDQDTVLEFTR